MTFSSSKIFMALACFWVLCVLSAAFSLTHKAPGALAPATHLARHVQPDTLDAERKAFDLGRRDDHVIARERLEYFQNEENPYLQLFAEEPERSQALIDAALAQKQAAKLFIFLDGERNYSAGSDHQPPLKILSHQQKTDLRQHFLAHQTVDTSGLIVNHAKTPR